MIGAEAVGAPIVELIEAVGTGMRADGDPVALLCAAAAGAGAAGRLGRLAATEVLPYWSGPDAVAASDTVCRAADAGEQLAEQGGRISALAGTAAVDVASAACRLAGIWQSFLAASAVQAPMAAGPLGQLTLLATALEHLDQALTVVADLSGRMAEHTTEMSALIPQPELPPVPSPSGLTADAAGVGGFGTSDAAQVSAGAGGTGTEVVLPDGSTVQAPTPEAAAAVRAALTQQGVPYSWGGTSPGQGLDCSGLTQWAYGQAGIDLPRTAIEQSVGAAVDPGQASAGDLVVWDGHVAMALGDGRIIEAGDPVQISPMRTDNIGMTFHGVYRPSAGVAV